MQEEIGLLQYVIIRKDIFIHVHRSLRRLKNQPCPECSRAQLNGNETPLAHIHAWQLGVPQDTASGLKVVSHAFLQHRFTMQRGFAWEVHSPISLLWKPLHKRLYIAYMLLLLEPFHNHYKGRTQEVIL